MAQPFGPNVLDPRHSDTAVCPEPNRYGHGPALAGPVFRWTPIRTISAARIAQSTALGLRPPMGRCFTVRRLTGIHFQRST